MIGLGWERIGILVGMRKLGIFPKSDMSPGGA